MKAALQFVLVVCIATLARATSVVAKVGEDKIVVAADTLGIDAEGTRHEDQRKIVPLGKYVFAGHQLQRLGRPCPIHHGIRKSRQKLRIEVMRLISKLLLATGLNELNDTSAT
jgi:hypothetical protein